MSRTATKIYFEYDDGFAEIARGEHAADVMRHLGAAQSILHVHGGAYAGKQMEECAPLIQEWQPIATAPINAAVLVYLPNCEHYGHAVYRAIHVVSDVSDRWHSTGWACGRNVDVCATHWMPLPDPPTEATQ